MAIPTIRDLVLYVNKKLTGNDWNTNWRKLINWLTGGEADLKIKSLEISAEGGLINNGSVQQTGNFTVDGNITASGNITSSGVISGDGSGLYNLSSISVFPYTPWSINSGFIDSNGMGDLISATATTSGGVITGYTIDFKVDSGATYGAIEATSASGEHFQINSLLSDTVSASQTFYFFIKKGETYTTKLTDIKIFRQPTAPTGSDVVDNNVWLDTSQQVLSCKKYSSEAGAWVAWDYVPLGKVTVTGIGTAGATATAETFLYNNNGYNIVIPDCKNLQQTNEYPRVIVKTYKSGNNWYRLFSDGWVEQGGTTVGVAQGNTINVTYPVAMADTTYCLTLSAGIGSNSGSTNTVIYWISTSGMQIWTGSPSYYKYYVCGYKA